VREQWDHRFAGTEFFYGEEPNRFVAESLAGRPPGRVLLLGEGEGRNAVHAAALGHEVTAVDFSTEARRKALALAAAREVRIAYRLGDVLESDWDRERWDVAILCFLHVEPARRSALHRRVVRALAPGGLVVLESFARAQLGRPSGGPPRLEWLHDLSELRKDFAGLELTLAEEREVELAEGRGHRGTAAVIRLRGVKPGGR
jgi:SAM-dependent methyltransferase